MYIPFYFFFFFRFYFNNHWFYFFFLAPSSVSDEDYFMAMESCCSVLFAFSGVNVVIVIINCVMTVQWLQWLDFMHLMTPNYQSPDFIGQVESQQQIRTFVVFFSSFFFQNLFITIALLRDEIFFQKSCEMVENR